MAFSWQQVAIVIPAAAGLVAVLTQWVALRGGSMKRLATAAEAAAQIHSAPEPERWLLEARFYNALRRDYYPARGWLALTLFLVWYAGGVGSLALASWAKPGIAGGLILFIFFLAFSAVIVRAFKRNFGSDARHLNAHAEVSELELAAIDKFLVERGRSPTPRDDFAKRMHQREQLDRLTRPVRDWWARLSKKYPHIGKWFFVVGAICVLAWFAKAVLA